MEAQIEALINSFVGKATLIDDRAFEGDDVERLNNLRNTEDRPFDGWSWVKYYQLGNTKAAALFGPDGVYFMVEDSFTARSFRKSGKQLVSYTYNEGTCIELHNKGERFGYEGASRMSMILFGEDYCYDSVVVTGRMGVLEREAVFA